MLGLLAAAGPLCYGVGLRAASVLDGRPLGEVLCFDSADPSHLAPERLVVAVLVALGAVVFLFVTPWLLGTLAIAHARYKRATAGAWSLAANSLALILICLILRRTAGIDRISFAVAWLVWTAALLAAAARPARCTVAVGLLVRRFAPAMAIALAAAVLSIVLFHGEQFLQCFDGDGTETYELARSLRHHFLPYWEMEWVGRFGTDVTNPSLINSYWTFALQQLLGDTELATRLPYWVWWLGIFAVALRMARPKGGPANWPAAVCLALLVFLESVWYTFYVGWNPCMVDLANPGVTDALFTLALLLAFDCLRLGDLSGWVVSIALASLVLYAGPVMFVLTIAAALLWQPVPRREMLVAAAAGTAVAVGIALFYLAWGYLDGSLSGWWPTIYADYVEYYIRPVSRWLSATLYTGYFLLGCGGVAALGLVWPFLRRRSDRAAPSAVGWERTVATVTVLYLLIVLGGGIKNLHYLGPLLPIPVILYLRVPRRDVPSGVRNLAVAGTAAAALVVSIGLSWPRRQPPFTLDRDLGSVTTFQTDSYEEACRWLRATEVTMDLYRLGHFGWYAMQHTWIQYSQLDADSAQPRPLLVTDRGDRPPGYKLVLAWGDGIGLYCRDDEVIRWTSSQRPPSGLDRCPAVFRPIAIAPFARSRH